MNKLLVVTGGSKGIGRAVAFRFAAGGFDVVACARNRADLERFKVDLSQAHPGVQVHTHNADLSNRAEVKKFTDMVNALNRPVDVLVNNAGYFEPGEISTEPDDVLRNMIDANLYSAYDTTRGLVGGMKSQRNGYIFNMCSVASIKAYPNGGSYAISKFALLGFSKCLREELKPFNVRVTAVMPGATKTASWDGVDLPEERFMPAEDVAAVIYSTYQLSDRTVVEELIMRPQLGDI